MTDDARGPRGLPHLAARAQLGDRAALEELLRGLQVPLLDHIRGIVQDDDLAADVLQDALIIVCRKLGSIRQTEWVRAWAYRVATRAAVRAARRSRRLQGDALDDHPAIPAESQEPNEADMADLLAELPARIASIPAAAQVVVRLHYTQSLTQQEIAEALEIPLGTVKSRLAYGLKCLRQSWAPP